MFNPELWQMHAEYKDLVNAYWRSGNNSKLVEYRKEYRKLQSLNLDAIFDLILPLYPSTGRPAKNQAQILRSFILLGMLINKTGAKASLTSWANDTLPNSMPLTVLVGCACPEELPPLGSYYDFMNRFWLKARDAYSRTAVLPSGKNGKKPRKKIGPDKKLEDDSSTTCKDIVAGIMDGAPASNNAEAVLQKIFNLLAVLPSIDLGLVDPNHLTISGDGTAVEAHASPYGKRLPSSVKDCPDRHYSDPDAEWGWDSYKERWYFGHTLYMLCTRNNNLKIELPLFFKLTSAKRHDSLNFLWTFDEFTRNCGLHPKNICLDSAHDNMPTYELLEQLDINALIDINGRSTKSKSIPADFTFNKKGRPVCPSGNEMCPWGNDDARDERKFRCPLKCGRIDSCDHAESCSNSDYGRTVYVKNRSDLRFLPRIPRDSEEYKEIYKERTASERINNRVLNDYGLQSLKIRGIDHFSFWTMIIGICIHLDARYKLAYADAA